MRSRNGLYLSVACLAAVVAVASFFSSSKEGGTQRSGAEPSGAAAATEDGTPTADRVRSASARPEVPMRLRPESEAIEPAGPRVDTARVEAAIARLRATTARITREEIVEEQKRMAEAKARFEAIKVEEPTIRDFVDQGGRRWQELRYPSGEIRYQPPPDGEASPAVPAGSDEQQ